MWPGGGKRAREAAGDEKEERNTDSPERRATSAMWTSRERVIAAAVRGLCAPSCLKNMCGRDESENRSCLFVLFGAAYDSEIKTIDSSAPLSAPRSLRSGPSSGRRSGSLLR